MPTSTTDTRGRHVVAELSGCEAERLRDADELRIVMLEASRRAGARVLNAYFHSFGPLGGVSGVVMLAESHLSIHTWPEVGYAAVDSYTCGLHVEPRRACSYLAERLQAQHLTITELRRGESSPSAIYRHVVLPTEHRALESAVGASAW
jgi:S-adenosylmethionine decarboxylase